MIADPLIVDEVARTYAHVPVEPGDVVLDLGAHVGAASVLLLDRGVARVIAVEPDPANLEQLRANLAGRPATVVAAAVGGVAGKTILHTCPGRGYLSTTEGAEDGREPVSVPVVAFGDLLAEHRPTIVKCDIEFSEYDLPELAALPAFVRIVAMELHLRYDLIFLTRRETDTEMRERRRRAAMIVAGLQHQGFIGRWMTTKLGPGRPVHDDTGFAPRARSIDAVWIRA